MAPARPNVPAARRGQARDRRGLHPGRLPGQTRHRGRKTGGPGRNRRNHLPQRRNQRSRSGRKTPRRLRVLDSHGHRRPGRAGSEDRALRQHSPQPSGETVFEDVREPLVDVYEEEDHVLVLAEIPGVSKKDVQLDLAGDRLTIEAPARREALSQGSRLARGIRRRGDALGMHQRNIEDSLCSGNER